MKLYFPCAKKIPLNSPFSKGEFASNEHFPSLKKHALSEVEGRGQGRFGQVCSIVIPGKLAIASATRNPGEGRV